jgi:hypothetical protein
MTIEEIGISGRLQWAGALLLLGLLTEAISLHWTHPIAFILFVTLGGALLGAGVLLFLFSLISSGSAQD